MFSICKSESTKSSSCLLDLEPLKHSIAERTMVTLALIQERISNTTTTTTTTNNKYNTVEALLASTLVSDQL